MVIKRSLLFILLSVFSFSAIAKDPVIHFEYYQRLVFLYLRVNETDSLLFLMDTGANASAIDSTTSDRIGLRANSMDTLEGTAGTIFVPGVVVKEIIAGNAKVQHLKLTKYDLSGSLAPPGKKLDGILGTDFLRHFCITINFTKQEMSVSNKTVNACSKHSLPFEMDNGIPKIRATLNKTVKTYIRYDSGSSLFDSKDIYINTTSSTWSKLNKQDSSINTGKFLTATGVGGEIKLALGKLKEVSFGNNTIPGPYIIAQPTVGYFARKDAIGFFGNNLMEKFNTIEINFITKKICLGL